VTSWSDLTRDWHGEPAPSLRCTLRELVLGAMAETILALRDGPGHCRDCRPGSQCADHRDDLTRATAYEGAYMRIRRVGSDGAMLEILGGLTP
jgi:hypothetical protein